MNSNDWRFSAVHFVVPKAGLLSSECEDAIALSPRQRRYCVADGATEAFDSRRWAKLLTRCWAANDRLLSKEEFEPWLAVLGSRFEQRWSRRTLPWYAEEKARSGAFAAFVGVAFLESDDCITWQAVALGDSCLVHMRNRAIVAALPISEPELFGYHPTLIPSNLQRQQGIGEHFTVSSGDVEQGDALLLLTDAIAAWYLRMAAEDRTRLDELHRILDESDFEGFGQFIARERAEKTLRNDDVAILRVAIDAPPSEGLAV